MPDPNLRKIIPPTDLDVKQRKVIFEYWFRKLAVYRNDHVLYAIAEEMLVDNTSMREEYERELDRWGNELAKDIWHACQLNGDCPLLDPFTETATRGLPPLPDTIYLQQVVNTTLFLHLTSTKQYSSHTRVFLFLLAPPLKPLESTIVSTLQHPEQALEEAEKHAKATHVEKNKILRRVGLGVGAVAGGVLIGVTGGLAAPLLGAGVGSLLGILGVGGTAAGILATGLASSSVVCGALFGAYGAKSTVGVVSRYTADVSDFAFIRVGVPKEVDGLGVRLCVSGWLQTPDDVTEPWNIFEEGPGSEDTFALQWEVKALEALSTALGDLVKAYAMRFVKVQIVKRTILASLVAGLTPLALLKIGQIVDNPWMKAKALADKTGKLLATLLSQRAFGNRPVTLVGYSLGAQVIFTALQQLANLPPAQTTHLVESVFLFGLPASTKVETWIAVRRVVSGRLVNGYSNEDWVLAVLGRATSDGNLKGNFEIAGLTPVGVRGVENLEWDVGGHLGWRGNVGLCLEELGVNVVQEKVERQRQEGKRRVEEIEQNAEPIEDDIIEEREAEKKKE